MLNDVVVPRERQKKLLEEMFGTVQYDQQFGDSEIPLVEQNEDDD